jgi:hypothetical protein
MNTCGHAKVSTILSISLVCHSKSPTPVFRCCRFSCGRWCLRTFMDGGLATYFEIRLLIYCLIWDFECLVSFILHDSDTIQRIFSIYNYWAIALQQATNWLVTSLCICIVQHNRRFWFMIVQCIWRVYRVLAVLFILSTYFLYIATVSTSVATFYYIFCTLALWNASFYLSSDFISPWFILTSFCVFHLCLPPMYPFCMSTACLLHACILILESLGAHTWVPSSVCIYWVFLNQSYLTCLSIWE